MAGYSGGTESTKAGLLSGILEESEEEEIQPPIQHTQRKPSKVTEQRTIFRLCLFRGISFQNSLVCLTI